MANSLLENKLLLQYLAAAGGALSEGKPIGSALGGVTMQNLGANAQAQLQGQYSQQSTNVQQLLKQLLMGLPDGAKISADRENFKFSTPTKAFQGAQGPVTEQNVPADQSSLPTTQGNQQNLLMSLLNPSASPPAINADLAGLTAQDVSQAFQGSIAKGQLENQTIRTMLETFGSLGMLGSEQQEVAPVEVPGVGPVTLDVWKSLPANEKEYAIFVHGSRKMGDTEPLSREEFASLKPTDRERLLRAYQRDPELLKLSMREKASGATRISLGEKMAEKKAISEMQGEDYFRDPKWVDDITDHLSSRAVKSKVNQAIAEGKDSSPIVAEEKVRYIEAKVKAGGGTIEDVKWDEDGKTIVWTVRWPSGSIERIRHAVRD